MHKTIDYFVGHPGAVAQLAAVVYRGLEVSNRQMGANGERDCARRRRLSER